MSLIKNSLSLAVLAGLLIGCGKNNNLEDDNSLSDSASLVESGITAISGAADDQSESSYAYFSPIKSKVDFISNLIIEKSFAASDCRRALANSCVNGVRSSELDSCPIGSSVLKATGTITLTYSDTSCDMSAVNSSVTRSYNYQITGPRGGGIVSNSSSSHVDFAGTTLGGGAKITKLNSGYQLDILGKHKVFTRRGSTLFDISVKSDTNHPLIFNGSLNRNQRQLQSGKLIVSHNLAKYKAVFTATNLVWSSSCCHPVGGTLTVDYYGSKSGQASVSFSSCGMAKMEKDGQIEDLELSYCE